MKSNLNIRLLMARMG